MNKFTINRNSLHTAEIDEPIVLYETPTTRCVIRGLINDTKRELQETVNGTIFHERKSKNSEWIPCESINLASLKSGEGVKIHLKSKPLKKLFNGLQKWYALSSEDLLPGKNQFTVGLADEILKVPKERQKFIAHMLSEDYGQEVWDELISCKPDLATKLSYARVQSERADALAEFKKNINQDLGEDYWQNFFNNNQWIFGYGLNYHFLSTLSEQPHYGGTDFSGRGDQKGDFLLNTEAETRFTVLVEIKKPSTSLFARYVKGTQKGQFIRYRNGAYLLNSELIGGVSQIQINCKTWVRNCMSIENQEKLSRDNIYTVCPRGILVIGNTRGFVNDRERIETFQSYRNNISNPEILTFDELYERAKYIVSHDISD